MIAVSRCPACGGDLRPAFGVDVGDRTMSVSACASCGSYVKTPYFDAAELAELYSRYDHHEQEFTPGPGELDNLALKIRRIERHLPERGRLLEIGCGRGWLLSQALRRGWDVRGVERAGSADRHLLPELRGKVHFIDSEDDVSALEPESYDAVCSYQVFEHLTKPVESLRSWTRALKPGGVLVLDTPNAAGWGARRYRERWAHHHRRDHFVLYTRLALERLARENGVRPLQVTFGGSPAVFTGPSAGGSAGPSRARRVFRHRLLTRFLRSIVHGLGLGDNIEVIGRKLPSAST
jgi:SAM-dependent methyltransferase